MHRETSVIAEETLNLTDCDREPIHVPGSIQPYGFLLVVDQGSDVIVQAAGDAQAFVSVSGSLVGRTVADVLGVSVYHLMKRADVELLREPTYLGTVGPFAGGRELTITAHRFLGAEIIEAEPAVPAASAAATLANIRSITERIGAAKDIAEACELAVREVRRITGYDRVMVYHFLSDGPGCVIAEAKDDHLAPFLNHHFPGSDIPKQAHELYKRNVIRVIPDVSYTPALLLPALRRSTGKPLDMSYCALRSVSPVHIQYLKNMGVGASMSVSLMPRAELWGLIACHNTSARPVPYEAREACRHVGQILSQQLRAHEESQAYRAASDMGAALEKAVHAIVYTDDPSAGLLTLGPTIQAIAGSHGAAVIWKDAVVEAGSTPSSSEIRQLAEWLKVRMANDDWFATDRLREDYPEASAFASKASGLLSMIVPGDDPLVVMWFRAEEVEEINWAGNPHEAVKSGPGVGALNPRRSFATWKETVQGRSRPWGQVELKVVKDFRARVAYIVQQSKVRQLNQLLADANERLAAVASTDSLTGIANRRAFDDHLEREARRARRTGQPLALITLDLDFFKQYNDHYGHLMGDECLKQVGSILRDRRRPADLAARIGGEEFAIVLSDTDMEGAAAVAEIVRARLESLRLDHAKSPMGIVTASFGVVCAAAAATWTTRDLMQAADKALYKAKESGRNRAVRG